MAAELDLLMQMANSLFTIGCGIILLCLVSRGRIERHLFYYGWSAGFILYGLQIFLRTVSTASIVQFPMFLAFLIFFPFSMFVLRSRRNLFYLIPLIFLLAIFYAALWLFGELEFSKVFWVISSIIFFFPLTAVILWHKKWFGNSVDKLLIGWIFLFFVNVFFPMAGWITDTLAIFGKIILLVGILSYDFAILTAKIHKELASTTSSPLTGTGEGGRFELFVIGSGEEPPLETTSKWLKNRVVKNVNQKINSSLIILQDNIPYEVLRSIIWTKPDLVHVFMFSQESSSNPEFTTVRFGITEIGATITELARKNLELGQKNEIFLVDLSIMIHTFGASEVYRLLLSKMGTLRSTNTSLITPFHVQTHEEQVYALFKTLASKIIQS